MEEQKLFGKLFDVIPLYDENHLETLLNTMTKETSIYILIQAINFSYNRGLFTIGESEVISRAIRVISKEEPVEPAKEE